MRKLLSVGVVVVAMLAIVAPRVADGPAQAATTTTVALTFDEGWASQSVVPALLDAHGMKGTFYINSGLIGTPGWLTWTQLSQFATDGQDIGGGSLNDVDLAALPAGQAQTSICEDRAALISHGFNVTNFAYPFGSGYETPAVRAAVAACGYNSARGQWGLWSPGCTPLNGCGPNAESIPPADPYRVLTTDEPQDTTTLETMESYVTNAAANGGGLVPIVFHQICDGCDPYSVSQATLTSFLDWLQNSAPAGTVVQTMGQVIGGAFHVSPVSSILCDGAPCSGGWSHTPVQVSLSAIDVGGSGLASIRYTTDGSTPSLSSTAYSAPFTVSSTTTVKYRGYDHAGNAEPSNSQLVQLDTAAPVAGMTCNAKSCSTGWYTGAVHVALSATDTGGSGVAAIHYTLDNKTPTSASPVYGGPLTLSASKWVKFLAIDKAGNAGAMQTALVQIDTGKPVVEIKSPANHADVTGKIKISIKASDATSRIAKVGFSIDGHHITTVTKSSLSVGWNTARVAKGKHSLSAKAFDKAGNSTTKTVSFVVV